MKKFLLSVSLAAIMVFLMAPVVQADIVYVLDHSGFSAGDPPYGTVTLAQNGTGVDVNVALATGFQFVRTGAGVDYNFLFNGTGIALSDLSGTGLTFGSGAGQADGSGNGWDFGVYFTGQGLGGSNKHPGPISFTVANAVIADLQVTNNSGNYFAADVITNGATGMVWTNDTPTRVPEPGTLMLLGTGLLGMAVMGRRQRRK